MIKILNSIGNTITSLLTFLFNSLESLINLIIHIPDYFTFITSSITVLPSVYIPFILATLSIFIVYTIMGRNLNG